MLLAGAIIALLILLTALYVAAEFAAVGIRRSRLRRLAEDGNFLAGRLLPVVEDPAELDRYIAVSQIGITLSSLILGAYGQSALAPVVAPALVGVAGMDAEAARSTAAIGVLLALTILAVIIGELVPKSLALQDPTRTGLATVLPMQWSGRLFGVFITFLNGSGILLMRVLGVPATGHRHVHSPEEIELLIAESRDGGLLEPEEQVRLHRALRLGLRRASQLMVPRDRLASVDARTGSADLLRIVSASPYSRLPVFDTTPDNVVGVLHTKDVVTAFVGHGRVTISALMRQLVRVPSELPADELLAFLRQQRTHQAFVVDTADKVQGLVTLEDVVAELLGGVADEFKGARRRLRVPERRRR
jgi:putative hemolysin